MRRFTLMLAFLFGLAATPFAAHAQQVVDDEDDDSMDAVTEGLPDDADEEARKASKFGLETAREARTLGDNASEVGKDFGKATAEDARDLGRGEGE